VITAVHLLIYSDDPAATRIAEHLRLAGLADDGAGGVERRGRQGSARDPPAPSAGSTDEVGELLNGVITYG